MTGQRHTFECLQIIFAFHFNSILRWMVLKCGGLNGHGTGYLCEINFILVIYLIVRLRHIGSNRISYAKR